MDTDDWQPDLEIILQNAQNQLVFVKTLPLNMKFLALIFLGVLTFSSTAKHHGKHYSDDDVENRMSQIYRLFRKQHFLNSLNLLKRSLLKDIQFDDENDSEISSSMEKRFSNSDFPDRDFLLSTIWWSVQ